MALAKFSRNCVATLAGHADVANNNVRAEQPAHFQRLVASQDGLHLMAVVAKKSGQRMPSSPSNEERDNIFIWKSHPMATRRRAFTSR